MSKTPPADAPTAPPPTGAEDVRWTLDDLCASAADLDADLATAETEAVDLAGRLRGRVGDLDAAELAGALADLADVHDRAGRAYTYAYLAWSTDTEDPARGALLQRVREAYTRVGQELVFFDVEWAAVEPDRARALLEHPELAPYRHYLELKTEAREHVLSEPEEKILAEKAVTGWSAWNRFFDETLGAARFRVRGESLPLQQATVKLYDADRSLRRDAAEAVTEGLVTLERPLTYVFNTVLADTASSDRLRHYPSWIASRNEANEIDGASVDALVEAVTGRYALVERFYALKRRLLGLDRLYDYDRYAPTGEADRFVTWDEAREQVTAAYAGFDAEMGGVVERFFDGRWIDAPPAPGKRGGAFSHGAVPSAHPYILMNYTGTLRDVQTLAHELGHGVHQYLARDQGVFHADTPLTTAETASVFGEMLTFQRMLETTPSPDDRLALLVGKIDDTMATVFRQVTMNRFEDRIHTHRRERGELTPDDFAGHWMATQEAMYGNAVTLTEGYRHWWSYIPHFVHTPGYVYAYAFGELLVLALYARYQAEGPGFARKYRDLLAAGGSDWPHVLVGRLGIDLHDPGFWDQGLDAVEALVAEAERLAAPSGDGQ
ncbi:M3 family oligoendopeptidase [Rubrivirga litoralis]|uniref:M3 family oligoendopeptidase n=1 Tax=Rubrivirga litoralis TaxID=3075598 RepID=A0ABU3BPJ6_9BACT|nr:M3 family oligoendopeptidase [Rubrivirga sp. F394]MDT0631188.1 M3 family oligoendopeptidase [Rubrivirga sp. F394]